MVRKCKFCHKPYQQLINEGISFHKFPKDDQLKEKWCEILGLQSSQITKYSELCSTHFSPDQLIMGLKRKYLKKRALPEIQFLLPDIPEIVDPSDHSVSTMVESIPLAPSSLPKDPERRRLWLHILGLSEDNPKVRSKNAVLCSDHFPSYSFVSKPSGIKYLAANTLPLCPNFVELEPTSVRIIQLVKSTSGIEKIGDDPGIINTDPSDRMGKLSPGIDTSLCTISSVKTDVNSAPESVIELHDETDIELCLKKYTLSPGAASTTSSTTLTASPPIYDVSPTTEMTSQPEIEIHFEPSEECTLSPEAASATSSTTLTASPPMLDSSPTAETESQSESEINCEPPLKKRKFIYPRYFGDCQNSDTSNPVVTERNWKIAEDTIMQQRKKIRSLQQRNRRLQSRIVCLKSVLSHTASHDIDFAFCMHSTVIQRRSITKKKGAEKKKLTNEYILSKATVPGDDARTLMENLKEL